MKGMGMETETRELELELELELRLGLKVPQVEASQTWRRTAIQRVMPILSLLLLPLLL